MRLQIALTLSVAPTILLGCNREKQPLSLQQPIQSVQTVGAAGSALPVSHSTPPPLPPLPSISDAQAQLLAQAQSEAAIWAAQFVKINGKTATPIGLIVAEPQADKNAKDDARQFSAGCARWLHLNAAGQGELNGTPLWGQADDARGKTGKDTLQFTSADIPAVARESGVSHVALGQWQENNGQATLTYQLWRTNPPANTGKTFRISGNREKIMAQLPSLAAQISRALGVIAPKMATPKATSAEMAFLGSVPWKTEQKVEATKTARLQTLAAREPLAGLLLLRDSFLSNEQREIAVAQMVKLAPRNSLVLADAAWLNPRVLNARSDVGAAVQAAQKKYPQNFLIAMALFIKQRTAGDRGGERNWIERAVRNAPNNPIGWTRLANTLSEQAQELRQSRFANQLNSREWKYLEAIYPARLNAYLQATRLNPADARPWSEVATAATFNSQGDLADAAFWKAANLAPHNAAHFNWGLQMYQPKWGGDKRKLLWVAQRIEADPALFDQSHTDALNALEAAGYDSEMQAMRDRVAAHYQSAIAKNPQNNYAHLQLAYLARDFYDDEQLPLASREFETYLKAQPDDNSTHRDYGRMLHYKMRLYRKAEKHYKRALEIYPDDSGALCALADLTYYVHNDAPKAEAMYRRAIAIDNYMWAHVELARLLLDKGKRGEAYRETLAAVSAGLTAGDNPIFERLGTPIETFQDEDRKSWQY